MSKSIFGDWFHDGIFDIVTSSNQISNSTQTTSSTFLPFSCYILWLVLGVAFCIGFCVFLTRYIRKWLTMKKSNNPHVGAGFPNRLHVYPASYRPFKAICLNQIPSCNCRMEFFENYSLKIYNSYTYKHAYQNAAHLLGIKVTL